MDDKVSYSTVNINISEVEKLTNSITKETSFGAKIMNAFYDSLYFFKLVIEKFVIIFIYTMPYLVIFGTIGFFIYKFTKRKQE